MTIDVSLQELFDTGAHFGHQTKRWNPKMSEYIFGAEGGVHIFDLAKTKEALETALEVLVKAGEKKESVIFVGTKKQAREKIAEIAKETGQFYVNERWLGGTLSNFEQIKKSLKKLAQMKEDKETGAVNQFTKKERVLMDREIDRLERFFGGLVGINELPKIIVVVDIRKEKGAIREANRLGITTLALVDSNCDPFEVDYPIPMNDDAVKAVHYVLNLMKDSYNSGKMGLSKKNPGRKSTKNTTSAKAKKETTKK